MAKRLTFKELVIWEDANYWVINKPPFISTLDDRNDPINILSLAKSESIDAQVCHRLDKETSGILIVAKNPEAYRHMSIQFENRSINKVYHAVADGIHDFKDRVVEDRILKLSNGTVKIDRKGKEAKTVFNTLHAFKLHTLIDCKPVAGRMHQIRIHLANLGASISGDAYYGGRPFFLSSVKRNYNLKKDTDEQPLIKRHALHAYELTFLSMEDEKITVKADYPKDFRVLVEQLGKNV